MNYPLISEYINAIRHAEDNLNELHNLRPVLDSDGEPFMRCGNYAVVFKMEDSVTGKFYALKCFYRESDGWKERYRQIIPELENVSSEFFTSVRYYENELFVNARQIETSLFPVLLMDWVKGSPLSDYLLISGYCGYSLPLVTYHFGRMASWLLEQNFLHGGICVENLLVKGNEGLVLVDYDDMRWNPSDRSLDIFSILAIALSLKAITLNPALLCVYGCSECLLFSHDDYGHLQDSEVLKVLQRFPKDKVLDRLLRAFTDFCIKGDTSQISAALFDFPRPNIEDDMTCTIDDDDDGDVWEDEFGVIYSADKVRLFTATKNIVGEYKVREETKVIYKEAFNACSESSSIILPAGLETIGEWAFYYCKSLSSVMLPSSLKRINFDAFSDCFSLSSVHLPDGLIYLGRNAFGNCTSLTSIVLPASLMDMRHNPFQQSGIKEVRSESDFFVVENQVLFNRDQSRLISFFADVSHYDVPDSVKEIADEAFAYNKSLKSVTLPEGLTFLDDYVFRNCKALISIKLPSSLTDIGWGVFCDCKSLSRIYIPKGTRRKFERLFFQIHNNDDCIWILREVKW